MFYLFSSTSRPLYVLNSLSVLGLPAGAIAHFRYDSSISKGKTWVDDQLLPLPKETPMEYATRLQKYVTEEVLVVFVQQPQDKTKVSDDTVRFFPLRKGRITNLELDGTILHAYCALSDYVNWTGQVDKPYYDLAIRDALGEIRPPAKYISRSQKALTQITFSGPADSGKAWESIVDALGSVDLLANAVFYRVTEMSSATRPWSLKRIFGQARDQIQLNPIGIGPLLPDQTGYILDSDRTYALKLSFYQASEPKEPVQGSHILPEVDASLFAMHIDPITVNFRYDKPTVDLVPKEVTSDTYTKIGVGPVPGQPDVLAPNLMIPLKLRYSRRRYIPAFIVLFIAQLMVAFPKTTEGLPPVLVDSQIFSFLISNSAIMALLGSAITAITLFFLLRKLPSA